MMGNRGGSKPATTGIAWYRPEQWERLVEIADDRGQLEATYEEWLGVAGRTVSELACQGVAVERVDVDVEDLLAWCNEQGRPVDGSGRANYVAEVMRRRKGTGKGLEP